MSVENFVPQLMARSILAFYEKRLVYANTCNRDYEGEIRQQGDSVKINSFNDPTVKSYTKNAGLDSNAEIDAPETLDGAQMTLLIDQQKYIHVGMDNVDARQADGTLLTKFAKRGAYKLADTSDQFVAALMNAGVAGVSSGAGNGNWLSNRAIGVSAGASDAYETLVDLHVKLQENDVPEEDIDIIVPPWYHGMLRKDPRFTSYGTKENRGTLANGIIGDVDGIIVRRSNNVPVTAGVYSILAVQKESTTFAEQIPMDKMEAYKVQRGFADAIKTLHLYGGLVQRPYGIARVDVTNADA